MKSTLLDDLYPFCEHKFLIVEMFSLFISADKEVLLDQFPRILYGDSYESIIEDFIEENEEDIYEVTGEELPDIEITENICMAFFNRDVMYEYENTAIYFRALTKLSDIEVYLYDFYAQKDFIQTVKTPSQLYEMLFYLNNWCLPCMNFVKPREMIGLLRERHYPADIIMQTHQFLQDLSGREVFPFDYKNHLN